MKNSKLKNYYAMVEVITMVNVPIRAESLEDALIKGKELKFEDIVEIADTEIDVNDYTLEVSGVFK